jgi:hypothetical protein
MAFRVIVLLDNRDRKLFWRMASWALFSAPLVNLEPLTAGVRKVDRVGEIGPVPVPVPDGR